MKLLLRLCFPVGLEQVDLFQISFIKRAWIKTRLLWVKTPEVTHYVGQVFAFLGTKDFYISALNVSSAHGNAGEQRLN